MQAKAILALIVCGELVLPFSAWAQTQNRVELRPPSAFATIPDTAARSRALFAHGNFGAGFSARARAASRNQGWPASR